MRESSSFSFMPSLLLPDSGGPGGIRSVVSESVLVKQQLLILNRSRQRSGNLRTSDRLFSHPSPGVRPGPKGPNKELLEAVVQMKQRNPTWGCPRIAQQI